MSDQTYNKVDLSLDEIIKLNRKEKKQRIRTTRGGSIRGGSVRGRGRGLQGQRIQGGRGRGARGRGVGGRGAGGRGVGGRGAGGRGVGGRGAGGRGAGGRGGGIGGWGRGAGSVSPLNRQKLQTGTVSATAALRGQGRGARRRGQGGIRRGIVGTRRGLRGGLTRGVRGGVRGTANIRNNRGILRGSLRGRGTRANLRGALRGRGGVKNQGQGQGQAAKGQGQVLTNQGQGWGGRGQGRGAGNSRFSLKQKREWALQTLHQARNAIAQLDQQTARQNFVNTRRGIAQQNQPLTTKKNQGMYSSTMSLTSNQSNTALTSTRQLLGTQVTTFNPVSSQQSPRGRRRWRQQNAQTNLPINNGSTLTISIDNSAPLSAMNYGAPQTAAPVPSAPQQQQQHQQQHQQHQNQRQRLRRRPWPRQSQTMMRPTSAPVTAPASVAMSSSGQEFEGGASAEFSQQLVNMKPTVSTKYVFEKTAFSTANTSCSLSDRFSGSSSAEILMGRKVFL